MNSSNDCHTIEGCPGLYVDAFRGHFLKKTHDPDSAFILTHYHGDHYGSLPREGKYQGLALIHCTPVTASLLIAVHQVPAMLVAEHEYGETFSYRIKGPHVGIHAPVAQITFYDANHCPGACIVLIQLPDGKCHLHTGDMRYHEKMKSYPLLREAVLNRKLDLVYLDTTYGHPKHDFVPQQEAIEAIASETERILGTSDETQRDCDATTSTLVLLSCYSIGKEKVLWQVSTRTNQLVYVSDRKFLMLQCIQGHDPEVSSQIITRCTQDPSKSDVHVIPMGLAGETWPFFRPNFRKCVDYARKLDKRYDRVVAFLPTGWANASNWNKKNAVSEKRVEYQHDGQKMFMDVEVRLISYSEHSAFPELVSFVEFLRPRKVIPTVYSDEADRRQVEGRFRNLLDDARAKRAFFSTMEHAASSQRAKKTKKALDLATEKACTSETCGPSVLTTTLAQDRTDLQDDQVEVEFLRVERPSKSQPAARNSTSGSFISLVNSLIAMGFCKERAENALLECNENLEDAIDNLLSAGAPTTTTRCLKKINAAVLVRAGAETPPTGTADSRAEISKDEKLRPRSSPSQITSFFSSKMT